MIPFILSQSLARHIILLAMLIACSLPAIAQAQRPITRTVDASNGDGNEQQLSPMEEEMRVKRQIEASDKAHKENLERARSILALSESVVTFYKANNQLDKACLKKLERAEKLVKKIRDEAGGSDPENALEEHPKDLATALTRLLELADAFKERVEKTPKRVVSAATIDEANVLLELMRLVRSMQARTT